LPSKKDSTAWSGFLRMPAQQRLRASIEFRTTPPVVGWSPMAPPPTATFFTTRTDYLVDHRYVGDRRDPAPRARGRRFHRSAPRRSDIKDVGRDLRRGGSRRRRQSRSGPQRPIRRAGHRNRGGALDSGSRRGRTTGLSRLRPRHRTSGSTESWRLLRVRARADIRRAALVQRERLRPYGPRSRQVTIAVIPADLLPRQVMLDLDAASRS